MRYSIPLLILLYSCGPSSTDKNVTVTGAASLRIVPDMVELSLSADNTRPALKDAVAKTQGDIEAILAVCRKYIQNPSDIKVTTISTNKSYTYRNNNEVFDGYNATQVLEVTLRDIKGLQRFTEELLATPVMRINKVQYGHTKADSIMREVNLMALEDARRTAEKMCTKMGIELGPIEYLSNISPQGDGSGGVEHTIQGYEMNLYNKSFGGTGFRMSTEILEFHDQAFARFGMK